MRKFTLVLTIFLLAIGTLLAQTPSGFKYQAVLHNADGELMRSKDLTLRLTILEGSSTGTPVYQEKHQVQTNESGLISINVGTGIVLVGNMAEVKWSENSFFLSSAIDLENNGTFKAIGVSQLLAVPYAMHAKTAEEIDDADADPTNELIETFEFVGNQLSITEAGVKRSVTLEVDEITDPLNKVLNMGNSAGNMQIKDLADPTDAGDAVNKGVTDAMKAKAKTDSLYFQASDAALKSKQNAILLDIDELYSLTTRDSIDIDKLYAKFGSAGFAQPGKALVVDNDNDISQLGDVSIDGHLTVEGNGNFHSDVNVDEDVQVGTDLTVTNRSYLQNGVEVTGTNLISQTTFTDETQSTSPADGSIVVNGGAGVMKNLNVGGQLKVDGDAILQEDLSVKGNAVVDKNVTVKKDLDVDGMTTLDQTTINTTDGNFRVDGDNFMDVSVQQGVLLHSPKMVKLWNDSTSILLNESEHRIYLEALTNDIHLDAGHDIVLNADGQVYLFGTEGVVVGDAGQPVTIGGPTWIDDNTVVDGDLEVLGTFSIPGTLQVGNLICDTMGHFKDSVHIDGSAHIEGDLQVDGVLRLNDLDIDGLTTLDETQINTDDGALMVEGANKIDMQVGDSVIIVGRNGGVLRIDNGELFVGGEHGTLVTSDATTEISAPDTVLLDADGGLIKGQAMRIEMGADDILLTASDTLKGQGAVVDIDATTGDVDIDSNADDVIITAADSIIGTAATSAKLSATAGNLDFDAGTDVMVNAGTDVMVGAGTDVEVGAGADVHVTAGDSLIATADDVEVNATTDVDMNVGQEVLVDAGAGVSIDAGATSNFTTSAGDLVLNGASDVDIDAQNYITADADSVVATARKSVKVMATDNVDVDATVDVLVDAGQDVLVTAGDSLIATADDVEVNATTDVDMNVGRDVLMDAGNDIAATAGVDVEVTATNAMTLEATNDTIGISAGTNINASAGVDASFSAVDEMVVRSSTGTVLVDAEASTVTVDGDQGVAINASTAGDVAINSANADVTLQGQNDVLIDAVTNQVVINAADSLIVNTGMSIDLNPSEDFDLNADDDVYIDAVDEIEIDAENTVWINGDSGVDIEVDDDGDIDLSTNDGDINIDANYDGGSSEGDVDIYAADDFWVNADDDIGLYSGYYLYLEAEDDIYIESTDEGIEIDAYNDSYFQTDDGNLMIGAGTYDGDVTDSDLQLLADDDIEITASGTSPDTYGYVTINADSLRVNAGTRFANSVEIDENLEINQDLTVDGTSTLNEDVHITSTTISNSYTSGALVVDGGVGIERNLYVYNQTDANTTVVFGLDNIDENALVRIYGPNSVSGISDGALVVDGGVGITEDINLGGSLTMAGQLDVNDGTASTSPSTGAVTITGGIGVGGAIYNSGIVRFQSGAASSDPTSGALVVNGGVGIGGNIYIGGNGSVAGTWSAGNSTPTNLNVDGTTQLDQTTIVTDDGAFQVSGNNDVNIQGDADNTSAADVTIEGTVFNTNDVNIPGALTVGSLNITNLSLAGTLDVDGATTLDAVSIATADGQFNVTGASPINMNVSGASNFITSGVLSLQSTGSKVDIDASTDIELDAGGVISLDAAATSNFSTSSGNVNITASTGQVNINGTNGTSDVAIEGTILDDNNVTIAGILDLNGSLDADVTSFDVLSSGAIAFNTTGANSITLNSAAAQVNVEDSHFSGGGLTLGTSGSIGGGLTIEQGTAGINGILSVDPSGNLIITLTNGVTTTVINLTNNGVNRSL